MGRCGSHRQVLTSEGMPPASARRSSWGSRACHQLSWRSRVAVSEQIHSSAIGSPMDNTGFAGLARALTGRYTVVTYDPRGIGHSTREDATQDVTPEQQTDDVRRLLPA